MNTKKIFSRTTFFILLFGLFFVVACEKEMKLEEAPRLFRPVVSGEITGSGNWLSASWTKVKGAKSYTAEISVDSFKTVVKSLQIENNSVVFENLEWLKFYRIRVKANSPEVEKNSGFSILGDKRTEKFPSIMDTPTPQDILDKAVLLKWINKDAPVTNIKITLQSNGTLVKDFVLNPVDITNKYKVISGLNPLTTYVATLFSGTTVRGYETFKTVAQIISGSNIVDLSEETNADILTNSYLASLSEGSLVILKRGMTYNITGTVSLEKSVSFVSEVSFFAPPAKLNMNGNFNFVAGSNVAEVSFKTIDLIGNTNDGYNSRYVFNINTVSTIGKVRLEDCKIKALRGVLRTQSGPNISSVSIHNCLVDSIRDYGVVNCDNAASSIQNVSITNSTVSDSQKFFVSKSNNTSVLIENCTLYYVPISANYFLDYNTFNVANGVVIKNTIFATGKPSTATPPVFAVNGVRPATLNITTAGNFKTSDLIWAGTTELPGLAEYAGTSAGLFKNPSNDDFTIIDSKFAGRATAGDPRWR